MRRIDVEKVRCAMDHMIKIASYDQVMCGVRLVDRVLTDILCNRVGVAVKIEDMIILGLLWWYGHVICGDINSQIQKVMVVEITGKRKKDQPPKSCEECIKKDLE